MDKQFDTKSSSKDMGLVVKRQIQMEAISKAIYLVTDLLEKEEPLRNTLRKVSVELLDSANKTESLQKLHSLLRLAKDIHLVSEMNASLLINAIEKTQAIVEEKREVAIGEILKTEVINDAGVPAVNTSPSSVDKVVVSTPDRSYAERVVATHHLATKPEITQYEKQVTVTRERSLSMSVPALDIGSRRKRILEVVKAKGQATINEFIESIQGCSSKTIQRELTSLVLSGTLKKTGERRWSKYSLK